MWEIGSSEGLGQKWPTPNSWERGEKEENIRKFVNANEVKIA